MKRAEVNGKFDGIMSFAEIEKLLDTPVKRYSSGMYVRLAFSVAAHLEPDILLIDEVLAVAHDAFKNITLDELKGSMNDNPILIDIRGFFDEQQAKQKGRHYRTL